MKNRRFEQLQFKVELWAENKGILKPENQFKQFAKVVEEVGELGSAMLKKDYEAIKDGMGDSLVTLIILSNQLGIDPVECLEIAYDEIKDRKGKNIDGTFVKN